MNDTLGKKQTHRTGNKKSTPKDGHPNQGPLLWLFLLALLWGIYKTLDGPHGPSKKDKKALSEFSKEQEPSGEPQQAPAIQRSHLPTKTISTGAKDKSPPALSSKGMSTTNAAPQTPKMILQDFAKKNIVPFQAYKDLAVAYGDVILGQLQDNITAGLTEAPETKLWETSIIPFQIKSDVPHPERIHNALQYLSQHSSLEFIPATSETKDGIIFEKTEKHCLSYIGKKGGFQPIFLSDDCKSHHVVHEVLHALGFFHEHSRADRDRYISVQWEAIPEPMQSQFAFIPEREGPSITGDPYDIRSIMHYPSQTLSPKSSKPSLLDIHGQSIPEATSLSPGDIDKLNTLYPR